MTRKKNIKNLPKKSTYPLLESLALREGQFSLLNYHQKRVDKAFQAFWPEKGSHNLYQVFHKISLPQKGTHKIRFLYDDKNYIVEFKPYRIPQIKKLATAQLPEDYDYVHKYTDRSVLTQIKNLHHSDEVLFFRKEYLTDAYYYNVLVLKNNQIWTPSSPLLEGCMRSYLLDRKIVQPTLINETFLKQSEGVLLINALNPIERAPFISRDQINFD